MCAGRNCETAGLASETSQERTYVDPAACGRSSVKFYLRNTTQTDWMQGGALALLIVCLYSRTPRKLLLFGRDVNSLYRRGLTRC